MNEDKLKHIEIILAHQEKQIADLSEMTSRQWDEIDLLKRKLDIAQKRIADMESGAKDDKSEIGLSSIEVAALNKPPHY